jgi:uncharacterized membrane protein
MKLHKLKLLLKHLWFDASDARRTIAPDMMQRLTQRVAASEGRHSGQIRICVEAALPMGYLWRLGPTTSLSLLIHQRALMMFSKLRVWDTAHNNGVLIYLQLTERMRTNFQKGLFEDGLTQALEEVSALLVAYFPATGAGQRADELPNEPLVQ